MKKPFEHYLAFIENELGLQLLPYQRELLRKCLSYDKIYLTMSPHVGRCDFRLMSAMYRTLLSQQNDLKENV